MKQQNVIAALNVLLIAVICILNDFYQKNGFDFALKCTCSGLFVLLGLVNCVYAFSARKGDRRFGVSMLLGLFLAFLGDVLIGYHFIVGAGVFALGHIFFVIAYGFLLRPRFLDVIVSAVLFIGAASFLLFSPLLTFDVPVFRIVCLPFLPVGDAGISINIFNVKNKKHQFDKRLPTI